MPPVTKEVNIIPANINFCKIIGAETKPVTDHLVAVIAEKLAAGQKVLWLVPGGSAIAIVVAVAEALKGQQAPLPLGNLTVTLTDERYGAVGHDNSNWAQLEKAGFSLPGAVLQPVLAGKSFDQTAADWNTTLTDDLANADYVLAFVGMGADGHATGVLPGSPALAATSLVAAYESAPYQRITTTPEFFKHINEAVIFAVGEKKWPALRALLNPAAENVYPAQLLQQVPKLTVFCDLPQT